MSFTVTAQKATNVPKEKFDKMDPYCLVTYQGQKMKTKVIKDSESPEWNETMAFDLAGLPLGAGDTIKVDLMDWERVGSDKLIGSTTISAKELINNKELALSLTLTDPKGRPTQTTLSVALKYTPPVTQTQAAPQAAAAGAATVTADPDEDVIDGEDAGDENEPDAPPEFAADGTPLPPSAAKRRRQRRKRRAPLSTKPQDFQVRVKIIEARQLEGSNVHPVCKVTLFAETKQSKVKRATGNPVWNETFYFTSTMSPAEIVDEMILFEVFNSKRLRSDAQIGMFKCDCGLIYDNDKHTVLNKWLLLTEEGDPTGVRGYLKVCMAILGPGDEAPSFKSKPGEGESEDIESNLLMPAGLNLQPAVFTLKVFQAEDLPRMDSAIMEGVKKLFSIGKKKPKELSDPYLVVSFAGQTIQSRTLYETYSPEFNQQLQIGFKFPSVAENITMRLYDWDRINQNDIIATTTIGMSNVSRSGDDGYLPTFGPCFINFYGSTREFCEIVDENENLNLGQGEGIAYRGRMLVELCTQLGATPDNPILDIDPEDQARVAKFLRRHKYALHVAFLEATMIADPDAPVEFEVSIGTYGNKLDDTVTPSASCTQPTNAIFDGNRYNFLPWENRKPCIIVESCWEDVAYRLETINALMAVVDMMEERFLRVSVAMKANMSAEEIQTMLFALMDELGVVLRKPLPTPSAQQPSNELDRLRLQMRQTEISGLLTDLEGIKQRQPENAQILIELNSVCETLKAIAQEPQNSIPDIFIWMLSGNKRKAFIRIPAHEVLYSPSGFSGRNCAKEINVILKHPGKKAFRQWEIPAKLRLKIWFGKKQYEETWRKAQTDTVVVMAETYENQVSLLGKWINKGPGMTRPSWSDATGDIKLKKESFVPPPGWQWAGDWQISPELSSLFDRDAGRRTFIEDVFELQVRLPGGPWTVAKTYWTDSKNDTMLAKDEIKQPEGWRWDNEWQVDLNRGVDDEGFEYCVESTIGGFGPVEKTYHLTRRRRWIRTRTMVAKPKELLDKGTAALKASEGWEYAPLFNMKFHCKEAKMDLVRRRRWHRKMVPTGPDMKSCYFSFNVEEDSDAEEKDKDEDSASACMAAPRMFLESSEKCKYQLRAYLYQARSLMAADDNGMSDPYAIVCFGTQSQTSICIKKTLSPTWDQTLIFDEIVLPGSPELVARNPPDVVIEIFDQDLVGKDEFIGRVCCKPIVKSSMKDPRVCVLQWHQVVNQKGNAGDLLASFELLLMNGEDLPFAPPKRGDRYIVPTGIRPVMRRTAIEILCWGVRNMKRYQLLSITSPSIEFEVGGTVVQSSLIKNTRVNPNFNEALLFVDTMLPKEDYFMPPINLRVRDHRAFGRKPTVGLHVITSLEKYICEPKAKAASSADEQQLLDGAQYPAGDTIVEVPSGDEKLVQPPEVQDIDWWCKYYASIGDDEKCLKYIQQGFDTIQVLEHALEDVPEFNGFADFCDTYPIMHGDAMDDDDGQEVIGEFKGTFKVYPLPEDPTAPLPPKIMDKLPSPSPEECVVRVYCIQANDLQPSDPNGLADPYVEVSIGKKKISLRDHYKPNTLNPVFGEMVEMRCILPLQKDLRITVKDYDLLSTDDTIGETVIDLENRYLSKYRATCGIPKTFCTSGPTMWRDSQKPVQILETFCARNDMDPPIYSGNTAVRVGGKTYTLNDFEAGKQPSVYWGPPQERLACYVLNRLPAVKEHIETRILRNKLQPAFDQGKLQCWVDIFPSSLGPPGPPVNIAARVPKKYILRVVIWNTTDVILDETTFTGDSMSDIYVKGWLPGSERLKTDIHYRSLDGDGNFNWRFVFPFEYLPAEQVLVSRKKEHFWSLDETEERVQPRFTVQIWDNDFISADDFLGSVELNIQEIPKPSKTARFCSLTQLPEFNKQATCVSLFDQKKLNGFWPVYQMVEGKPQLTGKVEMEMELISEEEAQERPAANGRDEPNMHPKLDPPNRPATSFFWFTSPFKSCKHILWRHYKWYIIGGLFLLLLIVLVIIFIYSFPSGVWNAIFGKGK